MRRYREQTFQRKSCTKTKDEGEGTESRNKIQKNNTQLITDYMWASVWWGSLVARFDDWVHKPLQTRDRTLLKNRQTELEPSSQRFEGHPLDVAM